MVKSVIIYAGEERFNFELNRLSQGGVVTEIECGFDNLQVIICHANGERVAFMGFPYIAKGKQD